MKRNSLFEYAGKAATDIFQVHHNRGARARLVLVRQLEGWGLVSLRI